MHPLLLLTLPVGAGVVGPSTRRPCDGGVDAARRAVTNRKLYVLNLHPLSLPVPSPFRPSDLSAIAVICARADQPIDAVIRDNAKKQRNEREDQRARDDLTKRLVRALLGRGDVRLEPLLPNALTLVDRAKARRLGIAIGIVATEAAQMGVSTASSGGYPPWAGTVQRPLWSQIVLCCFRLRSLPVPRARVSSVSGRTNTQQATLTPNWPY